MEKLALNGGSKSKTTPYHKPNRYGDLERRYLMEAIDDGCLMFTGSKHEAGFRKIISQDDLRSQGTTNSRFSVVPLSGMGNRLVRNLVEFFSRH